MEGQQTAGSSTCSRDWRHNQRIAACDLWGFGRGSGIWRKVRIRPFEAQRCVAPPHSVAAGNRDGSKATSQTLALWPGTDTHPPRVPA